MVERIGDIIDRADTADAEERQGQLFAAVGLRRPGAVSFAGVPLEAQSASGRAAMVANDTTAEVLWSSNSYPVALRNDPRARHSRKRSLLRIDHLDDLHVRDVPLRHAALPLHRGQMRSPTHELSNAHGNSDRSVTCVQSRLGVTGFR